MVKIMAVATMVLLALSVVAPALAEAYPTANPAADTGARESSLLPPVFGSEDATVLIGSLLAGLVILALGPSPQRPV
jgi:hypothetical protein